MFRKGTFASLQGKSVYNRMMTSKATTIEEYLAELPDDRREAISAVRKVILKNLPKGYEEMMQYGMISYVVPHSIYPDGYHCDPKVALPYVCLASQKNHMAVYMSCIYGSESELKWFQDEYKKTGKRMDMGKSCVRFRKLENLPVELIGQAVKRVPVKKFIAEYEAALEGTTNSKKKKK